MGHEEEPELDKKEGQACGARRACRCGSKARAWAVAERELSIPEEEEA